MSNNAKQVSVAVNGQIARVPEDLEITGVETALTGATIYGYASEDGVSISNESSTDFISAWQNSDRVRVTTSESSATYTFTLIQNSKDQRELWFKGDEDADTGKISWKPSAILVARFVIDYFDSGYGDAGEILVGRHVINRGYVTEVGEITLAAGDAIGYEITITAMPDSDGIVAEVYHAVVDAEELP